MSGEPKHSAVLAPRALDSSTTATHASEQAASVPPRRAEHDGVVVISLPRAFAGPEHASARKGVAEQRGLHVASNLSELVAATPIITPQDAKLAKERRDLNEIVHGVLIIGLATSTALMLLGLGLALFYQRDLPTAVPNIGDVLGRVAALRPSGFLALGLLVLIATPILRVVGSIGAFVYERDWRFAAITSLVLAVLAVSLLFGRG